jgi:hypothetical protein
MNKDTQLLSCPFCGYDVRLFGPDASNQWGVVCQHPECLCNVRLLYCSSREQAISQWNTRKDDRALLEEAVLELEGLRDHINQDIMHYVWNEEDKKRIDDFLARAKEALNNAKI